MNISGNSNVNIPISLRIFKGPGASPNVTELNILKIPNIQKNFWIFKFEYPNILKDIQVSWGISQCHRVEYPENFEYPEKFLDPLPMSQNPEHPEKYSVKLYLIL